MIRNISGVILAGGAAKRFNGVIKSKIILDGKSIISRIIEVYEQLFMEIIIVTNTPDEFADYKKYLIICDIIAGRGPLGGIHAAMCSASNDAVFVTGGDMPSLSTDLINKQAGYFSKIKCDILIPKMGELIEPLHGIYRKSLAGSLQDYLNNDNNYSVRDFLNRTNVSYLQLEENEKNISSFRNINSPEDLLKMKKLHGFSS